MKTRRYAYEGPSASRWNGGTWISNGYRMILVADHPHGTSGYVPEHRLVAESAIGRILPPAIPVHHVNDDRADNRNENLVICESRAYHNLLHQRMRAYRATGNPLSVACEHCKEWGLPDVDGMVARPARKDGRRGATFHKVCQQRYDRTQYLKKQLQAKKGV